MNTTSKTLCALLLGAALTLPAMAQDAVSANNGNSATAQNNAADAAPVAAPTMPVQSATKDTNTMDTGKVAMNTTGNAADLTSVPDTQKKYSRANRAKDYKKEAAVTAQLNQKESSMSGTSAQ